MAGVIEREPLADCDPEVYRDGELILHTQNIDYHDMEAWVRRVAEESGQRVDWHPTGGSPCVLALGDLAKVRETVLRLLPELDALQEKKDGDRWRACGVPFEPCHVFYEEGTGNPAHEAARRWNAQSRELAR
jgi:hypothetical protein